MERRITDRKNLDALRVLLTKVNTAVPTDDTKLTKTTSAYQYSETNVMHFLFNLLSIKGLYMFRALLAQPQEALHKRHWIYCVRVKSISCTRFGVPPEDEQVMLETCRGP
jgi:hypothetical protein